MNPEAGMRLALEQARTAFAHGEVPIGAVLTAGKQVLAADFNRPVGSKDPTAHAEILVLRRAAELEQNYRLVGTTLYVTVEPCLMCVGALIHARVAALVYGADEPKFGAVRSRLDVLSLGLNHRLDIVGGVLADEARVLMVDFFKEKRRRP